MQDADRTPTRATHIRAADHTYPTTGITVARAYCGRERSADRRPRFAAVPAHATCKVCARLAAC